MGNAVLAVGLLSQLLALATQASQMIQQAQASGTDITDEQLSGLASTYSQAAAQLAADIAAAQPPKPV